jgi:hypothetical protein
MTEELKPKTMESPTMPESPKGPVQEPMDIHSSLIAELEKLGVQKPEQLQGMAVASEQSGKLANMLGEIRRENAELRRMLQDAAKPKPQQHDPYGTEPIDIESVVERAVGKFYENKILKPQQEAQARFSAELDKVQSDDHFGVLGNQFEEYVKVPKVQYAISTGQTSLLDEYHRFKDRYFTNLLSQVTENYRKLLDSGAKGAGKMTPPHLESSHSTNYASPESTPDVKGKLSDIKKKSRGTDDDIDAMLRVLLPDGDPVLQRR